MPILAGMRNAPMKSVSLLAIAVVGVALGAAVAWPMAARAQQTSDKPAATQATPKGWSYEIVNGKRVPKGNRKVNADGSWSEEVRVGNCVTIKEHSASGDYKESRRCD
jgi:invasion protein IalB